MSTSAAGIALLDRVQDSLAVNEAPIHITRTPDGASMIVTTEIGDKIVVTAGDDGTLSMTHDDWYFTINEHAQPLDVSSVVGYIGYVASTNVVGAA